MAASREPEPAEQDLLEKIRQLDERQRFEVMDFIDFLISRESTVHRLIEMPREREEPEVSLREVRKRLSTIRGTMADTIDEMRDDRV